jgi:hypothetical protein
MQALPYLIAGFARLLRLVHMNMLRSRLAELYIFITPGPKTDDAAGPAGKM